MYLLHRLVDKLEREWAMASTHSAIALPFCSRDMYFSSYNKTKSAILAARSWLGRAGGEWTHSCCVGEVGDSSHLAQLFGGSIDGVILDFVGRG